MKTVSKKLLSLVLVAILLVSALPFQAFALTPPEPHDSASPTHILSTWKSDASSHWQECPNTNCAEYGNRLNEIAHTFDANGICTVCTYACTHPSTVDKPGTAVAANCVNPGKAADQVCSACGKLMAEGAAIPANGVHAYVNHVCSVCGTQERGNTVTLTLDANGGTVNGGVSMNVSVVEFMPISTLPDAYRQNYTFMGWYIGDVRVTPGMTYNFTGNQTAVAKWTEQTQVLTVRRILNGDQSTAKTLGTYNVSIGQPLLNFLNANVYSVIAAELAVTPGYSWQYNYWRDFAGTQPLTDQSACMNQAQTVFVNFVSNTYTLYFNANGGVVTPASKAVTFGSAVGTLPTPNYSGKVFQGWKDANGTFYTADTIYKVAGDTNLTAVWQDEALVMLYVYKNGSFANVDRVILMDKFVKGNNISRADVVAELNKYYVPASGYLNVAGLFDEYSWGSYQAHTSKPGVDNIQVTAAHPMKIYVMVNNANSGSTTVVGGTTSGGTTTGTTTGTTGTTNGVTNVPQGSVWVPDNNGGGHWEYPNPNSGNTTTTIPTTPAAGTNPKTGDTAMIEAAAAVMVLAAAALVTVFAVRKRKIG